MNRRHQPSKVVKVDPAEVASFKPCFHGLVDCFKRMSRADRESELSRLHAIHSQLNTKESEMPE